MQLRNLVPWVAAIALWPAVTFAGTVRVEKDGTGDFVTIQGGLDAAAPGDTVLIGPGRYETFTTRTFTTGGTIKVIGYTQTQDLTILGVDSTRVVLGPEAPTTEIDGLSTGGLGIDNGSLRTRVTNLTIENMQGGAVLNAEDVVWSSTLIRVMGSRGLQVLGADRLVVRDSTFRDMVNLGIDIGESRISRDVLVSHCVFTNIEFIGLVVGGAIDAEVEYCEFTGNGVGLQFEIFGQGRASNCTFSDSFRHLFAGTQARVQLESNHFAPGAFNAVVAQSAVVTGSDNYLGAGISWTARINQGFMSLTGGTIERGGDGSLFADADLRLAPESEVLDFRNNDWGTASRDSIAAWIFDGEDIPEWPVVLFEPFVGDPVPTEQSSFGSLKSRFRNE